MVTYVFTLADDTRADDKPQILAHSAGCAGSEFCTKLMCFRKDTSVERWVQ